MSGLRDISDHKLLKLLGSGSKAAFEEIYSRYAEIVYGTALRFLQNQEAAADLTQEIFIKLWTDRSKFNGIDNLRAYLVIMSRNLAIRSLRKIASDMRAREEWAMTTENEEELTADQIVHVKGMEVFLNETVDQLPPQQRRVYRMAREEGLTYKSIARLLNISPVTVKQHMVAANRFVRERWEQSQEM